MEVHGHIRLHMNGTHLHMQALESAGVCVCVWWFGGGFNLGC